MLFYITRDIERASGIDLERYADIYFIANNSPLAELLAKEYPERIILSPPGAVLNTLDLVKCLAREITKLEKQPQILVFKNSLSLERFCQERNWRLLNPSAELVNKFERKISQYHWLQRLPSKNYQLPLTLIGELRSFTFEGIKFKLGVPFILQYNIGHTGAGTKLIAEARTWVEETSRFPRRTVKLSQFIGGEVYTVNACVAPSTKNPSAPRQNCSEFSSTSKKVLTRVQDDKREAVNVLVGEVSLQLTGLPELTDNPFATVGNDWQAAREKLTLQQTNQIKEIARQVGRAMAQSGWRGLFGIDVVVEKKSGRLFLIEVNARQPASASWETQLAHRQGASGPLDWHLTALAGFSCQLPVTSYQLSASQIILRKLQGPVWERLKAVNRVGEYTRELKLIREVWGLDKSFQNESLFIIPNPDPSAEPLRIQILTKFPLYGIIKERNAANSS